MHIRRWISDWIRQIRLHDIRIGIQWLARRILKWARKMWIGKGWRHKMAKYLAVLGAVGAWWIVKEDYVEVKELIAVVIGYWFITKLWEDFIDL